MDFSEDKETVDELRKYDARACRWETIRYLQLSIFFEPSFVSGVICFGFVIIGILLMTLFELGVGGLFLCAIGTYILFLIIEFVFYKLNDRKSKEIAKLLKDKYGPIRNTYIENKANELGCTSIDATTLDIKKKEWDYPMTTGYIKCLFNIMTYIHSSPDNYGDILIRSIPDGQEIYLKDKIDEKAEKDGYKRLDVGVAEFNKKYKVYTKDVVKARTYFSATMIQNFINKRVNIDYRVFGNNIYLDWRPSFISPEFNFITNDIVYYFNEVDNYFNSLLEFKGMVENDSIILK